MPIQLNIYHLTPSSPAEGVLNPSVQNACLDVSAPAHRCVALRVVCATSEAIPRRRSFKQVVLFLLYDAVTGDLFNTSEVPSLHSILLSGNRLYGRGDNLFGSPNLLGMYVESGVPLEAGPLSDSICNSRETFIIISENLNLAGSIPPCLSLPELEVLAE